MSFLLNTTIKTARAGLIRTAIDAGSGPGVMKLYTGALPATRGGAITTQTLLGTVTFSDPSGSEASGVFTAAAITDGLAIADGDVGWGRILDSAGTFVADATATLTAGAGPIKLPSLTYYTGGAIHVTSLVITEGN